MAIQTGATMEGGPTVGLRLFVEYQRMLSTHWSYGVSWEGSTYLGDPGSDRSGLNHLMLNGYYRINLIASKVYWDAGLGVGGTRVIRKRKDRWGLTAGASVTLNIRLGDQVILQTSPLIILMPIGRGYFSTADVGSNTSLVEYVLFPVGFKMRL